MRQLAIDEVDMNPSGFCDGQLSDLCEKTSISVAVSIEYLCCLFFSGHGINQLATAMWKEVKKCALDQSREKIRCTGVGLESQP